MRKRYVFGLALVCFMICWTSFAQGEAIKKFDPAAVWMYHPEKDKYLGSYEWWYMDAHLENGYLLAIMFAVPNQFLGPYTKYLENASKLLPVPAYNPKDFATVEFSITDAKGNVLFDGCEDVKTENMHMPTNKDRTVKFNNCKIEMRKKGALTVYSFKMNIKDKEGNHATAILDLDSVPEAMAGWGHVLEAVAGGTHVDHKWSIFTPSSKMKANITLTNKKTGEIKTVKEKGLAYHDKNWGTHPVRAAVKGWIWTRIAEDDFTTVFANMPSLYGPAGNPDDQLCIIISQGKVIAATQAFDIIKGPPAKFRLPCPTEVTVAFKPESGLKGTLKFHDLKVVNCYEGSAYSRWMGKYDLDIDSTKYSRIKRNGTMLFEYTDWAMDAPGDKAQTPPKDGHEVK